MGASLSDINFKPRKSQKPQAKQIQPKIASVAFNSRSNVTGGTLKKLKCPLDISDFTSFCQHMRVKLWNVNFRFTDPSDLVTFEKKVALCNRICIEVAHIWIAAYVDYMIYFAWNELNGTSKLCYPPFAIQQVARLHSLYTLSYEQFCGLIYKEKGHLHFSPFKIIARREVGDYDSAKRIYHETREFLFSQLYQNPAMHKSLMSQKYTETVWEDFEMTVLKSEFSFSFLEDEHRAGFADVINREQQQGLLLKAQNPEEFLRVSKVLRKTLGISDLIEVKQPVAPRLSDQFIIAQSELTPLEREAAIKMDNISFGSEFVNILAWEQRIDVEEAIRWIIEYKKFIFLIFAFYADRIMSPSEIVDQVWHLHMQFVEDFQRDVCSINVIHHFPSKGGSAETVKYTNLYAETLETYNKFFGIPNGKIWPSSDARFSEFGVTSSYSIFFAKNTLNPETKKILLSKCKQKKSY